MLELLERFAIWMIVAGLLVMALAPLVALYGIWGGDGRWTATGIIAFLMAYLSVSFGVSVAKQSEKI